MEVYTAVAYTEFGVDREWLPKDLGVHPDGELWVVQHMQRDPAYDDETECTNAAFEGRAPGDCVSLQGSTVAITDPASSEPATADNGRARLVVDYNALHFMRRPSAIAFGAPELVLDHTHPGAAGADLTEPVTYTNTFATWAFDGNGGFLDRYDFGSPHHSGHYDHDDATIDRYFLPLGDELARVPTVPSNMLIDGDDLWVADTGNGRVLRIDLSGEATRVGTTRSFESYDVQTYEGLPYVDVLTTDEPSGLTRLPDGTMLVADHTTGELIVFERDGTVIRTIPLSPGLGGLTNIGDAIYAVQMNERRVVRVDPVD